MFEFLLKFLKDICLYNRYLLRLLVVNNKIIIFNVKIKGKVNFVLNDVLDECSNSSWVEMKCYVIGIYSLMSFSIVMK